MASDRNADSGIDAEAVRWNARYDAACGPVGEPAMVLRKAVRWLPASGRALDLACGRGANALWMAARGLEVSAWDLSSSAIEHLVHQAGAESIRAEVRDVVARPPQADSFELIAVSRYLERSLCSTLATALAPGGVLCYQTFTHGLSNPHYLLAPNELLTLFPTLDIRWYHEPLPAGRAEAMLVAQRPVT